VFGKLQRAETASYNTAVFSNVRYIAHHQSFQRQLAHPAALAKYERFTALRRLSLSLSLETDANARRLHERARFLTQTVPYRTCKVSHVTISIRRQFAWVQVSDQ